MTDAELSKAVAEACGIEVFLKVLGVGSHEYRRYTGEGADSERFDPANNWNDAMLAAEKCGLFKEPNHATVGRYDSEWIVRWIRYNSRWNSAINASGPRAICEAILVVAKERA